MELYPAVDIRGGRVVRAAGSSSPLAVAQQFVDEGAAWIHIVDLDAVFRTGDNLALVCELCALPGVEVQVGGNLDDVTRVEAVVQSGAKRVVLGTAVGLSPNTLERLIAASAPAVPALAIETFGGKLFLRNESRTVEYPLVAFVERLVDQGIQALVVRDVERDGTLAGAALDTATSVRGYGASVVYGGGVESLDDIRKARGAGLDGIIVGRALLDHRFTLAEALECSH